MSTEGAQQNTTCLERVGRFHTVVSIIGLMERGIVCTRYMLNTEQVYETGQPCTLANAQFPRDLHARQCPRGRTSRPGARAPGMSAQSSQLCSPQLCHTQLPHCHLSKANSHSCAHNN
eukprot:scaffold11766_cov23-Tisochrysis_lutea.AAC.2